jgi:hypothetical protein
VQAGNIRCINKALGASKGEIVVPELDLDQEVMVVVVVVVILLLLLIMAVFEW